MFNKYNGRIINHDGEDFLVMYKKDNMFDVHFFYIYKVEKEPSPLLRALGKTHKYVYIDKFCLKNFDIQDGVIEYWVKRTVDTYRTKEATERTATNIITEFLNGGKES
jgi:hypothetical protein